MHPRFQHRDHRDHRGLGDQREVQKVRQSLPDEGHQSLGHQLGEVRLDVEHQHPVDEVLLDVEHQHPVGEVRLDVVYPCPGLKRTDCCPVLPSGEGYPCPGLKRTGYFQDVECRSVECLLPEPEQLERESQVPQVLTQPLLV